MLQNQNESLESLSQSYDPLSTCRYSSAGVLSTDKQEHRSNIGIEVIFNSPISLVPNTTAFIIVMIQYLLENILLLIKHQFLLRILHSSIYIPNLLLQSKRNRREKKQDYNELHSQSIIDLS